MGKGPARKQSDQPRVRIAKTTASAVGIGSGKGGSTFTPDQCPVSLQKKVEKSALTVESIPVDLKRAGERYDILIGGTVIATMSVSQSKTITGCNELGIRYKGKIVVENETVYARFQRIA